MRVFESPDGTRWGVDVKVPSFSSAMITFKHPDGQSARRDRYAWYNSQMPEAMDALRSGKLPRKLFLIAHANGMQFELNFNGVPFDTRRPLVPCHRVQPPFQRDPTGPVVDEPGLAAVHVAVDRRAQLRVEREHELGRDAPDGRRRERHAIDATADGSIAP